MRRGYRRARHGGEQFGAHPLGRGLTGRGLTGVASRLGPLVLEGTVDECRADSAQTLAAVREARDVVIERVARRTGTRPATNPTGA